MKRKNRIQKKNINIIKEPPFINFFIFRREKNRGKTELFELEKEPEYRKRAMYWKYLYWFYRKSKKAKKLESLTYQSIGMVNN